MKRILATAILSTLFALPASAADRTLDLSAGCKVYRLKNRAWVPVNASRLNGRKIPGKDVVKEATFLVFRIGKVLFGVNEKCVPLSGESTAESPPRRAEAAPDRGETHSPWSAVFSLGYNLSPSGTKKTTFAGVEETGEAKFTGSPSFLGEANYRANAHFRGAAELGISQLSLNSQVGNETSFFDLRPEYVLGTRGGKWEFYVGPMIGIFFLSQNTETVTLTGANDGTTVAVKQQTATSLLVGVGGGVDYKLNHQFDLGAYLRYFKPGTLKVTGTESFPPDGNSYEAELSAHYINFGLRFAIHF